MTVVDADDVEVFLACDRVSVELLIRGEGIVVFPAMGVGYGKVPRNESVRSHEETARLNRRFPFSVSNDPLYHTLPYSHFAIFQAPADTFYHTAGPLRKSHPRANEASVSCRYYEVIGVLKGRVDGTPKKKRAIFCA